MYDAYLFKQKIKGRRERGKKLKGERKMERKKAICVKNINYND